MHHAYLIIGESGAARAAISKILDEIDEEIKIVNENYGTFGIENSRELIKRSARRDWDGQRECVVITARNYTVEAQNALLKLFEEPRTGLHFFILGQQVSDFLPTLRSRLMIIGETRGNDNQIVPTFPAQFLSAAPVERLDLIAVEIKRKLPHDDWGRFLDTFEMIYHKSLPRNKQTLAEISAARRHLSEPAVLPRLLFEHLAFVLPRVVK